MEMLFWLQPMFLTLWGIGIGTLSLIGTIFLILVIYTLTENDNTLLKKHYRKGFTGTFLCALLLVIIAPLTEIDNTYKHVLILRGINSETADKFINTADKILELAEDAAERKIRELEK